MNSRLALIGLILAAAAPQTALAQTTEHAFEPFALTISGGVSLGAYEAGLNWALVSFIKRANAFATEPGLPRPRLVALAGASAGSINALLAAAVWCQRLSNAEDATVDHNLLRDTWMPVSLDQLLPDDPSLYLREDALLSRRPLIVGLENVRGKIFDRKDGYAFIPGCQIPVGFTVTRTAPRDTQVRGLSTLTQRFVIPLVFEVTPAGWVRIRPQFLLPDRDSSDYVVRLAESREDSGESSVPSEQVSQAILASSAFPLAFSPRQICTCEATCPEERVVTTGSCRGLDPAHPIGGLTCAGLSSSERDLKLCRWEYVDGGIFDNGPLGLAIDQVESWQSPSPLHPVRYGFVDPDVRRSQSSLSKQQSLAGSQRGLAGTLQLLANLISTSRNADLARVIRAKNWNRTTETLVRELALTLSQFVFVYDFLQRVADQKAIGGEDRMMPTQVESTGDRARLGRLLYQCLEQLHDVRSSKRNLPLLSRCANGAQELRASRSASSLEQTRGLQPLSAVEVTNLARWLGVFIGVGRSSADALSAIPPVRRSAVPERARQEPLTVGVRLAAVTFEYLAGELPRVARSQLPEDQIREFRGGLLRATLLGERLSVSTQRLANAVLAEYLTRVGHGSGAFSAEALTALEATRGLGRGELFEAETLAPVVQSLRAAAAVSPFDGEQKQLSDWLREGEDLQRLRPLLQQITSKISTLVQSASELQQESGGERELVATSRFSPLAGSQLVNFAAFLDRPLREFDYYAGVYDAVHEMAVGQCANQDPFLFNLPAPEWRNAPDELDLKSLATQRCIGKAMGRIADALRLSDSTKARQIFGALASAELAVALGDEAAAEHLLSETDWLWLREYTMVVRHDSLGIVLETLLSRREPCSKDAKQSLCIAELSFDDFIAALSVRGYQPEEKNMRLLLSDPDHFWKSTVKKLADRSAVIELSRTDSGSSLKDTVLFGVGAGELWTRRSLAKSNPPRLVIDPSSLPSEPLPYARSWTIAAAHLIPYRIAVDVSRGGIALAWLEPELLLTRGLSIVSLIEPVDFESQGGRFSSTIGALPTVHFAGVSLGAGPRFSLHWPTSKGTDLGLEAQLSFLQDRFSLGMGVRQIAGAELLRNWFVFLGVSDVNGMIYWLGPWKSQPQPH